jgi:hypothetical protein
MTIFQLINTFSRKSNNQKENISYSTDDFEKLQNVIIEWKKNMDMYWEKCNRQYDDNYYQMKKMISEYNSLYDCDEALKYMEAIGIKNIISSLISILEKSDFLFRKVLLMNHRNDESSYQNAINVINRLIKEK